MIIRQAHIGDSDTLYAIEQHVFETQSYHIITRRQYRYLLTKANADILLAEKKGGESCGAAVLLYRKNADYARLYSVGVLAAYRGQGAGAALLRAAEERARQKGLREMRQEVREDNGALIARYRTNGYTPYGTSENYYPDGAACVKLKKDISSG